MNTAKQGGVAIRWKGGGGRRCKDNDAVVRELQRKYGFDIEVVKVSADEKLRNRTLPLLPALVIDGRLFSQDQAVDRDALERRLRTVNER